MFDIENHKEWIARAIASCTTNEQLECCKVMITLFVLQMSKVNMEITTIRLIEDNLLEKYLSKEAIISVP
jgi:hypothetical protein